MAQYDVHRMSPSDELVLDVQSDLLDPLNTRVVVPLMRANEAPKPARRLNPTFEFDGQRLVLVSQFLAAVRSSELSPALGSLDHERDTITVALDMVFQGF